jgi:hypothetical protein
MYEVWMKLRSMKEEVYADASAPETLKAALMAISKSERRNDSSEIINADEYQSTYTSYITR